MTGVTWMAHTVPNDSVGMAMTLKSESEDLA